MPEGLSPFPTQQIASHKGGKLFKVLFFFFLSLMEKDTAVV